MEKLTDSQKQIIAGIATAILNDLATIKNPDTCRAIAAEKMADIRLQAVKLQSISK
jgi:hypothetical protein